MSGYRFICSFFLLSAVILASHGCTHTTRIRHHNGLKETETFTRHPKRSTSYIRKGTIIYTDTATWNVVKKEKYREKVTCAGTDQRKRVVITYDAKGRRVGRQNLLRVQAGQDKPVVRIKF